MTMKKAPLGAKGRCEVYDPGWCIVKKLSNWATLLQITIRVSRVDGISDGTETHWIGLE
ncbi:hypothetical protein TcasGA2_TC012360 [Tribolium castaneum]|uniref:Uncharacterized protein n=1 Tax=Tribolium castaneum TaxID=7070 RepID=D6X1V7_TRICA|nr:hypothetical protein TcasGA2_TC012360 [Tribolium castaneum]